MLSTSPVLVGADPIGLRLRILGDEHGRARRGCNARVGGGPLHAGVGDEGGRAGASVGGADPMRLRIRIRVRGDEHGRACRGCDGVGGGPLDAVGDEGGQPRLVGGADCPEVNAPQERGKGEQEGGGVEEGAPYDGDAAWRRADLAAEEETAWRRAGGCRGGNLARTRNWEGMSRLSPSTVIYGKQLRRAGVPACKIC